LSHQTSFGFRTGKKRAFFCIFVFGLLASDQQAQGIKPFTTDIFKGFLAIFLLDMGIVSGRKLGDFIKGGWFTA
jgi:hypothetical protein